MHSLERIVLMVLAFAKAIQSRLETNPEDPTFAPEILSLFGSFPLVAPKSQFSDFDIYGTDLWNLSTRLQRSDCGDGGHISCLLRVFSCYLLDAADQSKAESWANSIRILKVVIRAAKTCIKLKELELATKMLELAVVYLKTTSKITDITPEDVRIHSRLNNENLLMRILLVSMPFLVVRLES
jgi:hypothetical protein